MFQHQSYDSHQLMPSTATQDIGSMATQDNGPFRHRTWHGRRGRLRLTQLPQREHPRGPSPLHHHPRQIAALPLPRRYGVDSLWLGWRLTSESSERSIMRFDCPVSWRMCRRNDIQLTWLHPGHGRSGPGYAVTTYSGSSLSEIPRGVGASSGYRSRYMVESPGQSARVPA